MRANTVLLAIIVVFSGCASVQTSDQLEMRERAARANEELAKSAYPYCRNLFANPAIDPIKDKMKISEEGLVTNPSPFSVLANNHYPDETEKNAIKTFAEAREKCNEFQDEITNRVLGVAPKRNEDPISKLLAKLYNKQITYAGYAEQLGTSATQPDAQPSPQQQTNSSLVAQCKSAMMGRPTKTGTYAESLANAAQCDADPSAHLRPQSQSNLHCVRDITGAVNCNSY